MHDTSKLPTLCIEGVYSTDAANQDILLYSGPLHVRYGNLAADVDGTVVYSLRPSPAPEATLTVKIPAGSEPITVGHADVALAAGDHRVEGLVAQYRIKTTGLGDTTLQLTCRLQTSEHGSATDIQQFRFHVLNFADYIGQATGTLTHGWKGRLLLEAEGWRVTLDSVKNIKTLVEELAYSRGAAITHVGQLERLDGSSFSIEAADEILTVLQHLFSFAMGHAVAIVLPVGFGADGSKQWYRWNVPSNTSWAEPITWFNTQQPQLLEPLFRELLVHFKDKDTREAHELSLYWYLQAVDDIRPDASLMVAHTCLELIAWFWLVETRATHSRGAFDDAPAKDKLRYLLSAIGVPANIPPELPNLDALAKAKSWADGPEAIATLRHAAIHPRRREQLFGAPERARDEAHALALWYLELSLLYFLGFGDTYVNRLKRRGSNYIEKVPWK